ATATNNTINLAPGRYSVKITKDGFVSWEKNIEIKPEEVYKTNVFLFPSLPDLRPLTLTGAQDPSLSSDGTKIAYVVASASAAERNGVWIADMGRLIPSPFASSADLRQIYRGDISTASFLWSPDWSPDGTQLLASVSGKLNILLVTSQINDQPTFLATPGATLALWASQAAAKLATQETKLAPTVLATLATASADLTFSPDETKILYQATSSAYLPTYLLTYLPGTNPTPQVRHLTAGNTYVYDLKEDRNYLIKNCSNCTWFPSSRHLLSHTDKVISAMEYDGTNEAILYAGPFVPPPAGGVFAWPNWSKIVILTSLNGAGGIGENLYTINLR
ncbi:PEGA domain-containing protein, partial [Patescibacteria group bacterium]|nr:PEGA domain-containing protein [Patescibacteria group bacterium]